jgi:tRNA (cmo5U34)-methyltransferase
MWNESDSATFLELGAAFVPDRDTQFEIICDLLREPNLVVELCCGEGLLSEAILKRFPECRVVAYDGSELMLAQARSRNPRRFEGRSFDLAATDWRALSEQPNAVVSSLAIHHLDGDAKRELYRDMFSQLATGGALVIADLIEPASDAAREAAATQWDLAIPPEHRERFDKERWNLYRHPDPETDKPSTLLEQLTWLREIGFTGIDVLYLRAGHAIFTGTVV